MTDFARGGLIPSGEGEHGDEVPLFLAGHWAPIGWQGAAQHTYTPACAGFHPAGACPPSQAPVRVEVPR
jgi:hypothetical protein